VEARTATGARAVESAARGLVLEGDHAGALDLLDGLGADALRDTSVAESLALHILADMWGRYSGEGRLGEKIAALGDRLEMAIAVAVHAKSLNVPRNELHTEYDSLVDYAARAYLRHEVMLDDHEFWPWINSRYPNAARFLPDDVPDTNALAQEISVHFARRDSPQSREAMRVMDRICRQAMATCPELEGHYARRLSLFYHMAMAEMRALAAFGENCIACMGSPDQEGGTFPCMRCDLDGTEHLVVVYAHNDPMESVPTPWGYDAPDAWPYGGGKAAPLDLAGGQSPVVMLLDATDSRRVGRKARERILSRLRGALPGIAELAVISSGSVHTVSVRGDSVSPKSGAARAIEGALRPLTA